MKIDVDSIISFLTSQEVQGDLFGVKVGFLVFSGLLVIGIIILAFFKTHYLQWRFFQDSFEFLTFRQFGARRMNRKWKKILKRLETDLESEYKLAIVEADNMLNTSLKRMGYMGKSLAERLDRLAVATLPNIDEVYQTHKICNIIVRNPDYRLSLDDAKRTINVYKKAFTDLQILT